MNLKKHINDVLENFFNLTDVPIQAFHFDGNFINSFGFNKEYSAFFDRYNLFNNMKDRIVGENEINVNIEQDGIYFSATPFCPKNVYRGIFIIGPYSEDKVNLLQAPYKLESTSKYMTSLVRTMWRDSPHRPMVATLDNKPYSIHTKRALDYIDSRYMDDINLDDVSSYLNISKPYFCSLFKKETGKTFTYFLNKTRIEKSKELLLNHGYSMLDIALTVGYNNQNYYNIIFKKFTDLTPLEYRNNHS